MTVTFLLLPSITGLTSRLPQEQLALSSSEASANPTPPPKKKRKTTQPQPAPTSAPHGSSEWVCGACKKDIATEPQHYCRACKKPLHAPGLAVMLECPQFFDTDTDEEFCNAKCNTSWSRSKKPRV